MSERNWVGLSPLGADGQACVICGLRLRLRLRGSVAVPVGRSATGSQVFACEGICASEAAATAGELVEGKALTAAGAAFRVALEAAGGEVHRARVEDLVTATVWAAAPLVVAAKLRRIATELGAYADELDPPAGEW